MKIVCGLLFAVAPTMPYTTLCTAIKFYAAFASDLRLLGKLKVIDTLPRNCTTYLFMIHDYDNIMNKN